MTWLLGMLCVFTHHLAGNFSVSLDINSEASKKSCILQLVIQHCTLAALANVATFIISSFQLEPCQFSAAGSLPLAHNAGHSTSLIEC